LAVIFSSIGVIRDRHKGYALAILLVSAVVTLLVFRSYGILSHPVPSFRPGALTRP